ncbi:hypothetical protein BDV96DRAFT_565741 [Lophiotrema nucula]|uniref:Uncharacterized protein n=1 Tax=Lophiotrema nucula TaxID=690887 RepID=A0A6A5ZMM3_9PLEO|nr:hypothetical protein BDV96DRAFT_565741 [Lophiotrema nucula]
MGQGASNFWKQNILPPATDFPESELPDQTGKVVGLVTGGYTDISLEVAKILYQKNATVYLAGRWADKGSTAVNALRNAFPSSSGKVEFLKLDLADLSTIKPSAEEFLRKERRLDVLVNNAGVYTPQSGSKSKQGYELQLATNVYGPF